MKNITATLLALALLSACHGSADIRGDGYRIKTNTHTHGDYRDAPRHCPPGHAKKGWC